MPKKRRAGARHARKAPVSAAAPSRPADTAVIGASIALLVAIVGAALLVDSGADASFDAPKRLVTLLGAAVAAFLLFGFSRWENPFGPRSGSSRWPLLLLAGSLALAAASALFSPRRVVSLDAFRALLVTALLLPIGASRLLERKKGLVLSWFLAVTSLNALVSILQASSLYRPFPLRTQGDRESTGAFVGNVGYLALTVALAGVAALSIAALHPRRGVKVAAIAAAALLLGALLVNQNLTSLTALAAGVVALLVVRFRRRALAPLAISLFLLAAAVAVYPATRARLRGAAAAARAGDWDTLLTYRVGPWRAALQMTRERPWLGWGPGTFGAEFVPHRLKAEILDRRRYVNPLVTSSYAEAHSDYLQPFAEAGLPAALMALGAAALLFRGLSGPAVRGDPEAIFLFGVLTAGAAAALTWFPLQRPITAVPLLLAAGRAWRVWRAAEEKGPS